MCVRFFYPFLVCFIFSFSPLFSVRNVDVLDLPSSPRTILTLNRVFAENLVGLGFLQSVSYIKPIPTHERLFTVGKSGPNATFKPFFSGLGWPWVGECVGFILIFTCFPTPQNLVNCKTPYYINNSVRRWKAYKENAFFHFRSAGTDLRLHEVQKGHLLTTKCHLFTVKRPPVHYDTSPVHDQMPPVYCEWAPVLSLIHI